MFFMADTLLGQVLDGRYRLEEIISDAGPRGVVYRAAHLRLDRTFVVKVFRQPAGSSFEAHARKLSCIRHPNIQPIHDYGRVDDGRPYLVMEGLSGESLEDRMSSPIDQRDVLSILKDVAAALAEIHAAELVHGDIKPANIFFEPHQSGEALKLTDFDLPSQRGSRSFIDDVALASADWVSPEQAKGLVAEPASDLYSLGAVAYACLAGHPPHAGDPHVVLSKKIKSQATLLRELPIPVDVDEEVDELIASLLEPEPYRRPTGAGEVAERAAALFEELAMPPPQVTRSRVPWFGLAATILGAAALAAAEVRTVDPPRSPAAPATGSVTLESFPSGAEIYVDGEPLLTVDGEQAVTPADVEALLFGKTYRVQLRLPGYVTWETEVEMSGASDGRAYRTALSQLPDAEPNCAPARLTVSGDRTADVYLDQDRIGSPPIVDLMLAPGTHLLSIKSATEVRNMLVDAEPGDLIRYHVQAP